jgi:hypothetical protein
MWVRQRTESKEKSAVPKSKTELDEPNRGKTIIAAVFRHLIVDVAIIKVRQNISRLSRTEATRVQCKNNSAVPTLKTTSSDVIQSSTIVAALGRSYETPTLQEARHEKSEVNMGRSGSRCRSQNPRVHVQENISVTPAIVRWMLDVAAYQSQEMTSLRGNRPNHISARE